MVTKPQLIFHTLVWNPPSSASDSAALKAPYTQLKVEREREECTAMQHWCGLSNITEIIWCEAVTISLRVKCTHILQQSNPRSCPAQLSARTLPDLFCFAFLLALTSNHLTNG